MINYEDVLRILRSGTWADLKGKIEGDLLNCKGKPYDLSQEGIKPELAKDISSSASAGGGFIVIGITTKRIEAHYAEGVDDFRLFERSIPLFDTDQYYKVLN
jgi:hypothetical protein